MFFLIMIPFLTRMKQNCTKTIITKTKMSNFFLSTKDAINGYVYVEKKSYISKLSMACNIGIANFVRTWCSI